MLGPIRFPSIVHALTLPDLLFQLASHSRQALVPEFRGHLRRVQDRVCNMKAVLGACPQGAGQQRELVNFLGDFKRRSSVSRSEVLEGDTPAGLDGEPDPSDIALPRPAPRGG
jgi:hypothetical protein